MTSDVDAFSPVGEWENPGAYRGALIIPVDPQGRILLQLRDHNRAAIYPGKWGLFGGEVEPDETILRAALREFREETGIRATTEQLRPFARLIAERSRKQLFAFEARLNITPADVRLGEGAGFAFLSPADALACDLVPATAGFLKHWVACQISRG